MDENHSTDKHEPYCYLRFIVWKGRYAVVTEHPRQTKPIDRKQIIGLGEQTGLKIVFPFPDPLTGATVASPVATCSL